MYLSSFSRHLTSSIQQNEKECWVRVAISTWNILDSGYSQEMTSMTVKTSQEEDWSSASLSVNNCDLDERWEISFTEKWNFTQMHETRTKSNENTQLNRTRHYELFTFECSVHIFCNWFVNCWSVCDPVVFANFQCGIDPRTSGRMDCDVIDVKSAPDESAKEGSYFHVMEVTCKCHLLGLSLLALADFAHM